MIPWRSFCTQCATPCLCMQGCTEGLSTRLLKWSQSIRISHVILAYAETRPAHAHSHRRFPHSYSVQPLSNSSPLSPKWCRDQKKANRKPRRGTRNNAKAAHYSKNSNGNKEKHNERVLKRVKEQNDPTHLHRHRHLVCMWKGTANSYQVSCMSVRSGQRNCIAVRVWQQRDSVPLYIASSLEHMPVGGDSSLETRRMSLPLPQHTHSTQPRLIPSFLPPSARPRHSTLLSFWLARLLRPAFQSVTMSTRCFPSSSVILTLSLWPSLCPMLTILQVLWRVWHTHALSFTPWTNQIQPYN